MTAGMGGSERMTDSARDGSLPRRRGLWSWIVRVLLVLLALFAALALVSLLTRQTTTAGQQFAAEAVTAIVVDTGAGNVEIIAEDRVDIGVTIVTRKSLMMRPNPTVDLDGDSLVLRGDCPFFVLSCGVDFEVSVPIGTELAMTVSTSAGSTEIIGLGGTITATGAAGNITVTDFRGTEASLRVSAGNITFSAINAPTDLRASVSAGNVSIVVPDEVYRVDTDTTAGNTDVTVTQDPASALLISAEATAGNIEIRTRP
jgi:hypothetical protein